MTRFFAVGTVGTLLALVACGSDFSAGEPGSGGGTTSSSSSSSSSSGVGGATGACDQGYSCVSEDWLGPVVVTQSSGDGVPPACPAEFASEVDQAAKDLSAPDAQCAACKCEAPGEGQCGGGEVNLLDSCGGNILTDNVSTVCTSLGAFSGVEWVSPPQVTVNPGPCAANGGGVIELAAETWETRVRVCGSTDANQVCTEGSGICVAETDPVGQRPVCIYRTGDVQCPQTGAFKQRVVVYRDVDDQRGCGPCACDDWSCAQSRVHVYSQQACNAQDLLTSVTSGNGCQTVSTAQSAKLVYAASCPPTGGQPTGEVLASDPVTLCCAT